MDVGLSGKCRDSGDTRAICLVVSLFSMVVGLAALGSGDPLADAAAILAALLASVATAMATVADPPHAVRRHEP